MKKALALSLLLSAGFIHASTESVIQQLASPSVAERDAAYQKLLPTIQAEHVPLLATLLQNPVSFDKALALLEAIKEPLADQALAVTLSTNQAPRQKIALLNTLTRRDYTGSVVLAKQLLKDPDAAVALAAMYYCAKAGDTLIRQELLSNPACPPDLCLLIAEQEHCTVQIPTYQRIFEDEKTPDNVRLLALCRLIAHDSWRYEQWSVKGLSSPSPRWRNTTAQFAATGYFSPSIFEKLPHEGRLALLTALANNNKYEDFGLFRKISASDYSPDLRIIALEGLRKNCTEKDIPIFVQSMASEDATLAETARICLSKLCVDKADKVIARYLDDDLAPELTVKLLRVLAARNAVTAGDDIVDLLDHPSLEVRMAAYEAIRALAWVSKTVVKRAASVTDPLEQQAAERALMTLARKNPTLIKMLPSRYSKATPTMKGVFIRATGVWGMSDGLDLLTLALKEKDAPLRDEAVRVLSAWKVANALPLLEPLLADYPNPSLRTLALRGYIRLIPEEREPSLRAKQCALAAKLATRTEEKRLLIETYRTVPSQESVTALTAFLTDPELKTEAAKALRSLASHIPVDAPDLAPGSWIGKTSFKAIRISDHRSEACAVADFNGDDQLDICAGPFVYLAPDWQPIKIREVSSDVKENGKGYADDFCNLVMDVNGDGKPDILSAGWFNKTSFWFENTLGKEGLWPIRTIEKMGNHETGLLVDITGDGKAEEFMPVAREAVWYEKTQTTNGIPEFKKYVITHKPMMLGLGTGDINGDGRPDVIYPTAWFQAPENPRTGTWIEHPIALGGKSNTVDHISNAIVFDMNKDGLNDIITSTAHKYGIWWYEQKRDADGTISWIQHTIDDTWSQAHYLLLADIDNDGKSELITGKRFMAHNGGDPDEFGTQCVYYYTFTPGTDPVFRKFVISYDEGIGAGLNIIAVDIDKDGDLDLVTTGKWGGPVLFENTLSELPLRVRQLTLRAY